MTLLWWEKTNTHVEREGSSLKVGAVSVDDFYLRGDEQDALAAAHPHNALLQFRGNAGSHDVALGVETVK